MSVQELGAASARQMPTEECNSFLDARLREDAFRWQHRLSPARNTQGSARADTSAAAWWWKQKVGMAGVRAVGPGPGVRFSDMHDLAPGLQLGLLVLVHFPRC